VLEVQGADTGERRLIVERDFTRQTLECKKIVMILNQPDTLRATEPDK
jgi:hypothetical protein